MFRYQCAITIQINYEGKTIASFLAMTKIMKVLANDGISKSGIKALEKGGFEVITTKVAQEQVINYINANDVAVLLVRSATKVRQDIIDNCPGLKVIGRGGVGMDNIDVE